MRGAAAAAALALPLALTVVPAAIPAARAADAAAGGRVAESRGCTGCHGGGGAASQPGIPRLGGQQAEFVALQLVLFREGIRDVEAMRAAAEGLTDAEIEDLGAWAAGLAPEPPAPGPRDAALAARGAAASARLRCGVCHTPDYRGQRQVPALAGQDEAFLAATLRDYRDGRRVGTDTQMNAAVHGVADAELDALAHHLAHHPAPPR